MKKLLEIMMKDIHSENFTTRECVIYGVIAPALLIAVAIIAG